MAGTTARDAEVTACGNSDAATVAGNDAFTSTSGSNAAKKAAATTAYSNALPASTGCVAAGAACRNAANDAYDAGLSGAIASNPGSPDYESAAASAKTAYDDCVTASGESEYAAKYDIQMNSDPPDGNPYVMNACDRGKYNDLTGRSSSGDCKSCPPGKGCMEIGMGKVYGAGVWPDDYPQSTSRDMRESLIGHRAYPDCAPGFFCTEGSPSTYPYEGIAGQYG